MDAVLRWDQPGEEGGPSGGAHWIAAQSPGKAHAFGRKSVDVWSADVRIAVTSEGPCTLVISQNEDHVGRLWCSLEVEKHACGK